MSEGTAQGAAENRFRSLLDALEREVERLRGDAGVEDDGEAEFVQLAMHDLQNAVALLETSMDSLYIGMTNLRPRELSAVRDARLAARRVQRYIDHLVTSERLSSGGFRLRQERVPIGPILKELVAEYAHYAADWGGTVTIDIDPSADLGVLGDEVLLTRVIQNLIENGLRHNRAGGRVLVEARATDCVEVRVCNEGTPIPPESRERVFQKFCASHQMGASGIGLYFSRIAVAAHGGGLTVRDDPEWPVCFVLRLPIASLRVA